LERFTALLRSFEDEVEEMGISLPPFADHAASYGMRMRMRTRMEVKTRWGVSVSATGL
jgi:hypothetical protein